MKATTTKGKRRKLLEIAEAVEQQVNSDYSFDVRKALIMSVTEGSFGVELSQPLENGDVYELLRSDETLQLAERSQTIAIVTCGWASPISDDDDDDNEMPPSQHPKRRRVRLVVCASRSEVASVLRFGDNPTETVIDEGKAKGSLADAIVTLMSETEYQPTDES